MGRHGFSVGQVCESSHTGLAFRVKSTEPLRVVCVRNTNPIYNRPGDRRAFKVGQAYSVVLGNCECRNFNFVAIDFGAPAPWVSVYEDGTVDVH